MYLHGIQKNFLKNPISICEQKIESITNAQPIKQHPYQMNPNYVQKQKKILTNYWTHNLLFQLRLHNGYHHL
jgi:hypothetical protein